MCLAGDVLDVLEQRHDWSKMVMTPELFKYVFCNLIPEVINHSAAQDEDQVREHYDREFMFTIIRGFSNSCTRW